MTVSRSTSKQVIERLRASLGVCADKPRPIALTIPAPVVSPARVFELWEEQPAYYFASGDAGGDVALGAAHTLTAEDLGDLATIESEAQAVVNQAVEIGIDASAKAPRFFGGFSYAGPSNPLGPWRSFARVHFDLPRYRYLTDGKRASLTLHLLLGEVASPGARAQWVDRTEELLQRMLAPRSEMVNSQIRSRRDQPTAADWQGHVTDALNAIADGSLEKVVLAREVVLEFDRNPNIGDVLERLRKLAPETTRFAIRKGRAVFLGATPERLVTRFGSELRTEAVAGSIRASDPDAVTHLMQSTKERLEHELVVRELKRKLTALGARPDSPQAPSIRQLRHVLHLATTITARLFGPPHILTLVSRLHPTPAVGGVPEAVALDFLKTHEGFERGWYAAPIGWFDAQGDGDFVVALRSGLFEDATLRLFAGAGIVEESQPIRELQETELKLQGLLDALDPTVELSSDRPNELPSSLAHPMRQPTIP